MQLRPYQEAAIAAIRAAYKAGKRAPLLCAPTGAGKSAMVKYMLGQTRKRVLYLCHRAELAEMIHADLAAAGLPHGMITARSKTTDDGMNLHVGMVQTVARRLDKLPVFDWVISDEAHLAMSDTWRGILHHYSAAWHLGMSATPCRLDGRGLGDVYDEIVYGPSVRELTDGGYLTRYRAFAPAVALDGIKRSGGDFQMGDAARVLDTSTITGDAIREYGRRMPGKRAIVFCCTREHADHVAGQFRMGGIPAANVDGSMSSADRSARIDDFRAGRLMVLTNVDLLTTGFDMPSIAGAIFLRPTQSLALYLQMVGRILRIAPGKDEALILDHVGNVLRHGLPDTDRQFTLDGKAARAAAPGIRQCPECFAAFHPQRSCPECGYVFPVENVRGVKKEVAGELVEVARTAADQYREWLATGPFRDVMRGRRTYREINEVAEARGYKPAWVYQQMKLRGGMAA